MKEATPKQDWLLRSINDKELHLVAPCLPLVRGNSNWHQTKGLTDDDDDE
jgi:hypothetical protein